MDVFVSDLDEYGAGFGEQLAGGGQAVAEVGEVRVDAVAPGVAEGFDLFGFAGDVLWVAVRDVSAGSRPLEVGVEADAVRRVDVDALDLPAQAFALGEGRHDLQAVAENHAVGPVGGVPVELGLGVFGWQAVEVGEQVGEVGLNGIGGVAPSLGGFADEVVYERLRVNALLNVKRRGADRERIGFIGRLRLAAPDELGVEIGIPPPILDADRRALIIIHKRLMLRARQIGARGVGVREGCYLFGGFGASGHLGFSC